MKEPPKRSKNNIEAYITELLLPPYVITIIKLGTRLTNIELKVRF